MNAYLQAGHPSSASLQSAQAVRCEGEILLPILKLVSGAPSHRSTRWFAASFLESSIVSDADINPKKDLGRRGSRCIYTVADFCFCAIVEIGS